LVSLRRERVGDAERLVYTRTLEHDAEVFRSCGYPRSRRLPRVPKRSGRGFKPRPARDPVPPGTPCRPGPRAARAIAQGPPTRSRPPP
jgi:hypothetical protein